MAVGWCVPYSGLWFDLMRIPHLRGRFGRKRGWRRRIAAVGLLLILCLVAGYLYLANPQRLSGFASRLLQDMTGAEVAIDEARFGIDGKIHLRGLRLRVPHVAGDAGRLFEAEQVSIDHRLTSLLRGRFEATSLVIFGPTLVLTQDLATEKYNYQVMRELRSRDDASSPVLERLPELFVRNGAIEFAELEGDRLLPLGKIQIDGKLARVAEHPGTYFFALRQMAADRTEAQLTGRFNLHDLSVAAELDSFSFDNPYGSILPRKLRAWWQRLNPAGSMPTFRIAYDPDPTIGMHAVIEVRDVELSLPYADTTEDGTQPAFPRMRNVSGTFALVRDTVLIDSLRGTIEGIGYQIDGRIDGLDEAAPFRFAVRTDEFDIPADRSLYALPRAVEKEIRRFEPAGRFHAQAIVERRRRGAPIDYDGTLSIRGADIRYVRFPYPMRDVHGTVRFTDERIDVERLDGRGPNGGRILVTGSVAPPGDGAAVELHILVTDLPTDDHLLDNLEPQDQRIINIIADRAQHARIVELGLLRTGETGDAPRFELGGRINVQIHVTRNFGPDERYVNKTSIDVAGVNVMFRYWPYPLQLTSGKVHIEPGLVRVDNVHATGPHGGSGRVAGTITKMPDVPGRGERWDPDIHIVEATLPLDELMLATIPQPHDHWLREFHLRGTLDATAHIFARPDGEVTFTVDTRVRDATADPFGSGFAITGLAGDARIEEGRVTVTGMTGQRGESVLTMDGRADWSRPPSKLTLSVAGTDLRIEPQLLGLIPPDLAAAAQARALFDAYRPTGRFDARFDYVTDDRAPPRFDLQLQPKTLAVDLRGKRVAFDQITGNVQVAADEIRLDHVTAHFAHGTATASGLIHTGSRSGAAITFTAEATRIDAVAKAVLPPAVTRIVEAMEFSGGYVIPRARFVQRVAANDEAAMEFEGVVQLRGASATVGVPIAELDGELYVLASQAGDAAWPRVDLRLDAGSLRAAGRLMQPLQLHLLTSDQRLDLLHVRQLRGVCYGGLLVGEGWIDLARQGMYRIAASLSEVELTPFMNPQTPDAATPQPDSPTPDHDPTEPVVIARDDATPDPRTDRSRGVITASLTIEGMPGEVASRRGRGALVIRNAALYELPLALAALQIANLTLPQSNAFDRASAQFILDADTLRFDAIRFEAPTVEMSGDGTMQLSNRKLDLRLVSRNPAAPQLGAVSDLFNVVKDELIAVRVTGTLDEPVARVTSFRGMKRSVDRVLGSPSDEKPRRATPPSGKRRQRRATSQGAANP